MQRITHREIQKLAHQNNFPSVSLYASLDGDYYDIRERLLRQLREARHQLEDHVSYAEARELLSPMYDAVHNRNTWWHETYDNSIAMFLDKDGLRIFALPDTEPDSVNVSRGFKVHPVLEQLTAHGRFYSLLLTTQSAQLVRSDVMGIQAVATVNAILSNKKASGNKDFYSRKFGHDHNFTKRYLNRVDREIRKAVDDRTAPLILVGLPKIQAAFRDVSKYQMMMPQGVQTNPDPLKITEIIEKARPIAQKFYGYYEKAAQEELATRQATDAKHVVSGVRSVLNALAKGKVKTLFINPNKAIWGAPVSNAVHPHRQDGDVNLTNLAVREALDHDTEIFHLPTKSARKDAVAILRY